MNLGDVSADRFETDQSSVLTPGMMVHLDPSIWDEDLEDLRGRELMVAETPRDNLVGIIPVDSDLNPSVRFVASNLIQPSQASSSRATSPSASTLTSGAPSARQGFRSRRVSEPPALAACSGVKEPGAGGGCAAANGSDALQAWLSQLARHQEDLERSHEAANGVAARVLEGAMELSRSSGAAKADCDNSALADALQKLAMEKAKSAALEKALEEQQIEHQASSSAATAEAEAGAKALETALNSMKEDLVEEGQRNQRLAAELQASQQMLEAERLRSSRLSEEVAEMDKKGTSQSATELEMAETRQQLQSELSAANAEIATLRQREAESLAAHAESIEILERELAAQQLAQQELAQQLPQLSNITDRVDAATDAKSETLDTGDAFILEDSRENSLSRDAEVVSLKERMLDMEVQLAASETRCKAAESALASEQKAAQLANARLQEEESVGMVLKVRLQEAANKLAEHLQEQLHERANEKKQNAALVQAHMMKEQLQTDLEEMEKQYQKLVSVMHVKQQQQRHTAAMAFQNGSELFGGANPMRPSLVREMQEAAQPFHTCDDLAYEDELDRTMSSGADIRLGGDSQDVSQSQRSPPRGKILPSFSHN